MSPSCITGPSPSIRMNPFPPSPQKSQSSTTSLASTSTSARWTPSGSTGCTTVVCICWQGEFPMLIFWCVFLIFLKDDNGQIVMLLVRNDQSLASHPPPSQLALSLCWTSVLLSMPASVGWSRPPLMMLTGFIPRAELVQRITHSWENGEVRAE